MSTADESRAGSQTDAPPPEDSRKPDAPTDLTKPSWSYIIRKTFREFTKDQCLDLAASLTYYATLSLFPALLAIVSLLGVVGQAQQTTDAVLGLLSGLAPADTINTVRGPLESLTSAPAAGLALIVGIAGALWSASGYVGGFGRAMNRIYETDEGRPVWKLRPVQLLITLVIVILIAIAGILLAVSGPVAQAIGDALGLGGGILLVWNIVKWPVLLIVVIAIVALLYHATPNVRQPKFRWISVGAVVGIIVWILASTGFAFYVANFSNYNKTYGSLGGVIVFLLWLWITNLALLFGAEFDAEIERGRELQAGIPAEESIQLPPRDTRQIKKAAKKDEKDLARGRSLREQADRGSSSDERDSSSEK
ncbi:YihY/virulence factor BrkB family protein [Saxibacter everestensis]|uniref:YihY/virulence factor BrkB family protein n=1 Tax=Saxibacter everestensis TaxID=2909229 RepID=A0ABY8QTH5_9MICO|nr:YihY/virulence factor BrkB family protein [Brevibacteriaceae bacterium ZFBP1038]